MDLQCAQSWLWKNDQAKFYNEHKKEGLLHKWAYKDKHILLTKSQNSSYPYMGEA